jgi:hypothetical protein
MRTHPKTIRFPAGSDLLAWFIRHARDTGISTNGALILALEKYRAEHNGAPPEGANSQ